MSIPNFDAEPALQAYLYAQHRNFIKGYIINKADIQLM